MRGAWLLLALLLFVGAARAQESLWIEAEKYASATVAPQVAGWGRKELLSGGSWAQWSLDAGEVEKKVPEDGLLVRYEIDIASPGRFELWNRLGYEFVRSPFAWRVHPLSASASEGGWTRVSPDELTVDLQSIETWNEVAWLKLGEVDLRAGKQVLEIRLPRTKNGRGELQRILYAADALLLHRGRFYPHGAHPPGAPWRTERDERAAAHVFRLPERGPAGGRTTVSLAGDWEVCRSDEQAPPFDIAQPLTAADLPEKPFWSAIPVPSDKNVSRPDLLFAHRLWYRARVAIPASHAGRSFFLTFPRNNLNTTVFVNGLLCGFEKNPNVRFQIDITRGVRPGQVNEIQVGIRDAWYGYSTSPKDPMKLRRKFNLPLSVVGSGFQDLAYPVWRAWESGIVQTPTLTSAGAVYASDVFVQPGVARKTLTVEVTLRNPGSAPAAAAVHGLAALDERTGALEKAWKVEAQAVAVPAGGTARTTITVPWPEARLWWPEPNPALYRLRVAVGDDLSFTRFGFREWGARGKDFLLNGIVWHGWADLNAGSDPKSWLSHYRRTNQRFMRLSGYAQGGPAWLGLTPSEALDFFDGNGVAVRRSGDLDGEAIGYMAIETDPDLKALYGGSEIKWQLIRNWKDQMVAQVRAERNHPSIHLWSIENEFLYINCINLYGGLMDAFEAAVEEVGAAVAAADPTRLWMTDGGGAGKASRFPVQGDHYVFRESDSRYPDLAYQANPTGGGRGRWTWDERRPRYLGEDFFATGIHPADYAMLGGEETFAGKAAAYPAAGRIQRMLTEGYRWAGYGAFHFWLGADSAVHQYGSNAEIAVFVREADSAFGSGQTVARTLGIFNDSFHTDSPITLAWTLTFGGRETARGARTLTVPRGEKRTLALSLPMPAVTKRTEGKWTLTLSAAGKEVFRDTKPLSVLPAAVFPRPEPRPRPGYLALLLYDPKKRLEPFFVARRIPYFPVRSLTTDRPAQGRVVSLPLFGAMGATLIVAPEALTEAESASAALAAFAASGGRAIVLEQRHPLRGPGLPAEAETTDADGRVAFFENAGHPVGRQLRDADLFTGGIDRPLYRNAYEKPTRGARSLVQCGPRLTRSALLEAPVGEGVLLLCQLTVGENLPRSAVARALLANLIGYAAAYRPRSRPVFAAIADPQLGKAIAAIGLKWAPATSARAALRPGALALVSATPANLKALAADLPALRAFTRSGGYLFLHDLTPDGLADFNRLVGVPHMIRPFRRERFGFAPRRPALAAGLSAGDLSMLSGERIFPWTSDEYVAADTFRYVVDSGEEVARFGPLPEAAYFGYSDSANDHNPENIRNGFTSSDGWVFVFSQWVGSGPPRPVPFAFPRPQRIAAIEWTGNAFYYPSTKIALTFDGKERVELPVEPGNRTQTIALNPPRTASKVELQIIAWRRDREPPVVGIENVRLLVARDPAFARRVRPLLDIGALVEYPDPAGKGGIVLCNLLFQEREAVPVNASKKRRLLAALLRHLDAPLAGERTVVAGAAGLAYAPVEIGRQATQYRNERGWFGDPAKTFAALPTGPQRFADVPFWVYDFPTSPVPNCLMLGGPGVPNGCPDAIRGIPVGRKADALFFLHTARLDVRRTPEETRRRRRFEMARYVVTYADGQQASIPLFAEEDVDDYRQAHPGALPGALRGWSRPYPGADLSATAWVKPWTNPRPEAVIRSIDLEYGPDRRGVPVLLALTAATRATRR